MDALRDLRIIAVREALGEIVGADVLIATGLQALLEGVDSPTLPLLAGLGRSEEGEAHDLFRRVTDELDLTPPSPLDTESARWDLVRWACEAIVEGKVAPEWGGRLIWYDGWNELGYPNSLQGIVGSVSEWDDWSPTWEVDRERFQRLIVEDAERLLAGPWPPFVAERLGDAVALWNLNPKHTPDVIEAAVACLVAGADTPSLRVLAGASPTDSQFELDPLIAATCAELHLETTEESTQAAAMRSMARRYVRSEIGAKALTEWAHRSIGHDGDERCQSFVELDDIFDVELDEDALDQRLRAEVDAFLDGRPSPMHSETFALNSEEPRRVAIAPRTRLSSRLRLTRFRRRRNRP